MDTKTLLTEAKARFNHNSAKAYLAEKYQTKLIVAEQGGLWKADAQTIGFLNSFDTPQLVIIDTFENPVQVNRVELLSKLQSVYQETMNEWYTEWRELEGKR
jgi:hypothetical protein